MVKNKITIDNDLIKDLKTYSTAICVSLASQVRDEMYKEAQFAIDAFYNDYEPLYYKRHFYNFKKNSFKKYYKNPHNSIVRGGVELTPYEMDDLYRLETEYVFSLVYVGYHGNAAIFPHNVSNIPPIMSPSPLEMLLDKRDHIVGNIGNYKGQAIDKAGKKSYSTIHV